MDFPLHLVEEHNKSVEFKKTSDFLDRSTWILATMLLALILISNITLSSGEGSLDSKLIENDSTEQTIPETPEQIIEEIPEIPEIEN